MQVMKVMPVATVIFIYCLILFLFVANAAFSLIQQNDVHKYGALILKVGGG